MRKCNKAALGFLCIAGVILASLGALPRAVANVVPGAAEDRPSSTGDAAASAVQPLNYRHDATIDRMPPALHGSFGHEPPRHNVAGPLHSGPTARSSSAGARSSGRQEPHQGAVENFVATVARLPDSTPGRMLVAFAFTAFLIPWTLAFAAQRGLVDRPGGRKQHEFATPVTGGLVLMLAMLLASILFGDLGSRTMYGFFIAGGLMVTVGFIDDLVGLGWKTHVLAQVIAALLMVFIGGVVIEQLSDVFGVPDAFLGPLAIPFTILVVIGVVNALNMNDGSDGLAAGQALVSLGLFAAFALYAGNAGAAGRLLMICAAIAGFMLWNLRHPWQPRARVFLGNAGSLLLGFIIAWTAVRLTQNPAHPISPVLGPWTIALPLIDCVTLMIRRWRQGRSPFRADRDHLHHMLLDAGYSPTRIALGMMGVSLLLGLGAAAALKLGVARPLLVVAFLLLWAVYYWLTARRDRAVSFFHRFHWVPRVARVG